jgi:PEP-CTERM motif
MPRAVSFAMALAFVVAAGTSAHADIIRWHLPGVIDDSFQCDDPDADPPDICDFQTERHEYLQQFFPVGTRVDFDLAIDTQDLCSAPDVGIYDIKQFDVTINGVTARGSGVLGVNMHGAGGCPFVEPGFGYIVGFFEPLGGEGQTELLLSTVEMLFGASPGDDLPTVPPAGPFYLEPNFHERLLSGQAGPGSVVPEPSTFLLVLGGLAATAARRRRTAVRRRRSDVCRRRRG